jgi:hypothetical protein
MQGQAVQPVFDHLVGVALESGLHRENPVRILPDRLRASSYL